MKLQRDNWTVRWAYLFTYPPCQTSLCPLFWRIVLLTPLKVGLPLSALFWLWFWVYYYTLNFLGFLGVVCGIAMFVGAISGLVEIASRARRKVADPEWRDQSVVYAGYRGIKDRVCPLVQIEP